MPREENGPVSQQDEFGPGQPKLADVYRPSDESLIRQQMKLMRSHFEKQKKTLDDFMDDITRYFDQHAANLKQDARQPRLAIEADMHANTMTRERTESAATAVQAMRGDSFSARRVDPGAKTSTSFGVKTELPALPCRNDVVVESGDAAPKSCLPSLEMHSPRAAVGLVSNGKTSTATETNFNQPPLRFYSTEETDSEANSQERTSTPCVSYDSSVFQKNNLVPAPSSLKVIETKPIQNRTFDTGDLQGHPRACPFLGSWCALVCGEVIRAGAGG